MRKTSTKNVVFHGYLKLPQGNRFMKIVSKLHNWGVGAIASNLFFPGHMDSQTPTRSTRNNPAILEGFLGSKMAPKWDSNGTMDPQILSFFGIKNHPK